MIVPYRFVVVLPLYAPYIYYTELSENVEARPSSRGATFMVAGCSSLLTYKSHVVGVIHQRTARFGLTALY